MLERGCKQGRTIFVQSPDSSDGCASNSLLDLFAIFNTKVSFPSSSFVAVSLMAVEDKEPKARPNVSSTSPALPN